MTLQLQTLWSKDLNWKFQRGSRPQNERRWTTMPLNEQLCLQWNFNFRSKSWKGEQKESQCKINNTRKDIFRDAAHVLGPWIDFFFSITLRLAGEWRWRIFRNFFPISLFASTSRSRAWVRSFIPHTPFRTCNPICIFTMLENSWTFFIPHQPTRTALKMPPTECDSFNDVWGEGDFPTMEQSRIAYPFWNRRNACNLAEEKLLAVLWAMLESHPKRWSSRCWSRDYKSRAFPCRTDDVAECWARRSSRTWRRCWSATISVCPQAVSPSTCYSWHLTQFRRDHLIRKFRDISVGWGDTRQSRK